MPTPFDALDAALSASCDAAFGEPAVLRPRKASQYAERAVDPTRPVREITGIFSAGPGETRLKGKAMGTDFGGASRVATTRAEFWIAATDAASIGYEIRTGDVIVLTDRDASVYEVVFPQRTDLGDLNLILAFDGEAPVSDED